MLNINHLLKKPNNQNSIDYLQIRRCVGYLGIALPVVTGLLTPLFCRQWMWLQSISNYYYTVTGNVFTGILCGVALFLYSYKGPQRVDNYVSNLACIFALGVAFFPMNVTPNSCLPCNIVTRPEQDWRGWVHYISAACLFATLAGMSLFLFTKTNKDLSNKDQKPKRQRNRVYIACGIIMVICLVLAALFTWVLPPFSHCTFIFEAIMLFAFSFSWLVKGNRILNRR